MYGLHFFKHTSSLSSDKMGEWCRNTEEPIVYPTLKAGSDDPLDRV